MDEKLKEEINDIIRIKEAEINRLQKEISELKSKMVLKDSEITKFFSSEEKLSWCLDNNID